MLNNHMEGANERKTICRDISVYIDIDRARRMLIAAGFDVQEKSDEEIADLAIEQCEKYGVSVLPF